ncbi:sulfite exporter TauE/SafE family protein [Pinirhizobacter soli]|uniref:sulfite exporter TauE/SafE family protein n=1 Tax=Pinirhizobacter soli TaxID=2786953 RepID=UPI00202A7438|nr:sulfite exporter TauE/SafE family protein [Pinirhizobacter soli]
MFAVVFVVALAAFTISAFTGGGAGLVLLPILALWLPAVGVPAALSIGSTVSSVSRLALFRRHIRWDVVRWFLPTALPGAWLGAWLLALVDLAWLELCLGFYLLASLWTLLAPGRMAAEASPVARPTLAMIGLLAGFVSGLTGAVGLVFNRFYLRHGMAREEIVATRAANEITLHVLKIALYASFGLLDRPVVAAGLLIGVAALLAAWLARGLLSAISEAGFRRAGYLSMVGCGAFMAWNASSTLVARHGVSAGLTTLHGGAEASLRWGGEGLALEWKFDEGFEFERIVPLHQVPPDIRRRALALAEGADQLVVEEVRRPGGRRSYEIHAWHGERLVKETMTSASPSA